MKRSLAAALLLTALPVAAESFIAPLGTPGLVKGDLALVLYDCTASGCVVGDDSAVTVTEQANGRDYLFDGLPDPVAGSGEWHEVTWEASGSPGRYAYPIQTRTPQVTSATVSYRVPATITIAAGDTLPAADVSVSGLGADPTGADVAFNLWSTQGTLVIDAAAASVVDADAQVDGTWTATFRHSWSSVETSALSGAYYGRFTVTFSGGGVMTVPPAPGSLKVQVYP
jgi:hypothetical protein